MNGPGPPTAVVTLEGRGGLPFARLWGVSLTVHVVRTLGGLRADGALRALVVTVDAAHRAAAEEELSGLGVEVHDAVSWWAGPGRSCPLLLADPLCPLVPTDHVAGLLDTWSGAATASYRPVTDTLKSVLDGRIVDTVDRERYVVVTSPVLVPSLVDTAPTGDYGALVTSLRARGAVRLVEAPSLGRRVSDATSVRLLECSAAPAGRQRSISRLDGTVPAAARPPAGPRGR